MRLTPEQIRIILATVARQIGPDANVVLFGSRVADGARGGDIDLLIESPALPGLRQRASIKSALESALQVPVDILGKKKDAKPTPFQAIALMTGIPLRASS